MRAARIVSPRFYQDSLERMAAALADIRSQGCRFLVAARVDAQGRFLGLDDLDIPAVHRDLFVGIPAAEFRLDPLEQGLRIARIVPAPVVDKDFGRHSVRPGRCARG